MQEFFPKTTITLMETEIGTRPL